MDFFLKTRVLETNFHQSDGVYEAEILPKLEREMGVKYQIF